MKIFTSAETIKLNSILKLILPSSESSMPKSIIVLDNLEKSNIIHCKFIYKDQLTRN